MEQETNAYAVLPDSQWRGYRPPLEAPAPAPGTWGEPSPMPSVLAQAAAEAGDLPAVVGILATDPPRPPAKTSPPTCAQYPEASAPFMQRVGWWVAFHPVDLLLCTPGAWGCRFLTVAHRNLVAKILDATTFVALRAGADADEKHLASFEVASLRGRTLRFADLTASELFAADLTGADLRHADLSGTKLKKGVLQGAQLQGADLRCRCSKTTAAGLRGWRRATPADRGERRA